MRLAEEHWPKQSHNTSEDNEIALAEIVKRPRSTTHSLVTLANDHCKLVKISNVVDCHRYSSKMKLLRVTAYVLRFVALLRRRADVTTSLLTAEDLKKAEVLWIKDVQSSAFSEEIQHMRTGQTRSNQRVNHLRLFFDAEGIIRCEGRLENSTIQLDAKKPILLPSKHYVTGLIIDERHAMVQHNGIKATLNCVRERYWILRGREAVKRVLRKCFMCKKLEGKPYPTPKAPSLPSWRVSDDPPFTHTGLDFAGPLFVKEDVTTAKPKLRKVYVTLFTCASTRAVHLELLINLSTDAFLQAFRRFSSRRGTPRTLISDNAKTFKSAAKELSTIKRSNEVERYLSNKGVTWEFITEKAPWHGGFWERLIKSVKRCLKKSIGRASLSFEELRTILIEIESTLNSRPLTYVYDDEEGILYPLTPSALIYGRRTTTTPNDNHYEIVSTNRSLTRRATYQRKILNEFTKQWRKEYLLSIRECAKSKTSNLVEDSIAIGDIVILKDEGSARIFWKLAKVEELIRSKDNVVRSAKIRVLNNQNRKPVLLRRPIQHLIPLEVRAEQQTKN